MDSFVDIHGRPVDRVELAVGETRIVGLKKFNLQPMVEVGVVARNSDIAFSQQCVHLGDKKESYNDVRDMAVVAAGDVPIESHGRFFFQILGKSAGDTELDAFYWVSTAGKMGATYAPSLPISVKPNSKLLVMPAAPGRSVGNFQTMWDNHPLKPDSEGNVVSYPCNDGGPPLVHMQCFVRLCLALDRSGVSFKGVWGSSCQLHGAEHAHHFSNPYDFPTWLWAKGKAYVWQAQPPFSPEPMPGLAAFKFVEGRQGIILFTHYFSPEGQTSMWGGHIDLWNKDRMGNTYAYKDPRLGEAAFLRSEKISFWPLVAT
jgi:Type VI secretion system (T6SS), amidase effector protein 4